MTAHTPLKRNEAGNVLFYILIAVTLIGALSYTVAQSMRGDVNQINKEQAELAATEILEYANILANATGQLRLRGCKSTEISFEGATGTYTNANAPSDNTCHIFNVSGGGVVFTDVPENAQNTSTAWAFSDDMEVNQIGTTCAGNSCTELAAYITDINETACTEVNRLSGIDAPDTLPSQTDASYDPFQGTYAYVDTIGDEAGSAKLTGKSAGCFESVNDGMYIFYRVLIAR